MPNAAVLLQEFYPSDVRVRKELNEISKLNWTIYVFCLKKTQEPTYEDLGNVKITRLELSKNRGSFARYLFEYFTFFFKAKRWLKDLSKTVSLDVVHVHNLPDFLVFAAKNQKKQGAKIILDMHEITPEFFMSKYNLPKDSLIIRLIRFIEKRSIEFSDYVITVNKQLKEQFEKRTRPKNEITVIMNTVNEKEFPVNNRKPSSIFKAVYHGTLTDLYNLEFAIEAISAIRHRLNNFEFHIYGNGTNYHKIKNLVSELKLNDQIFVHGHVDYRYIPEILSDCDLGILPLRKDVMTDLSFSNKLGEYVHYKIPVLCTRLNAISEYFTDEEINYFANNDKLDFGNKLLEIINNPSSAHEKSARAKDLYKHISWDVMGDRLTALYKSLAN